MMKNMMKTACAIAVLAASANVMAESVDLTIKGTIAPIACKPNISGGGVIDYGVISPDSLKTDDFTNLSRKTSNITITCDAPAKLGLYIINNRQGTTPGYPAKRIFDYPTPGAKLFDTASIAVLGLGMANDKPIGAWAARFVNVTADNTAADVIRSNNNGDYAKFAGFTPGESRAIYSTLAKTGELLPVAAKVFSYDIEVEAYINKASELDVSKPAALDGSATIELVYI